MATAVYMIKIDSSSRNANDIPLIHGRICTSCNQMNYK